MLEGYDILAKLPLHLQHFNETLQIIHEAQARKLDDLEFHGALYALAFLGVDSAAMAEQLQWFAGEAEVREPWTRARVRH